MVGSWHWLNPTLRQDIMRRVHSKHGQCSTQGELVASGGRFPFFRHETWHGYGSIPINIIFRGMNIHLPAILMLTRGTRFWHTATCRFVEEIDNPSFFGAKDCKRVLVPVFGLHDQRPWPKRSADVVWCGLVVGAGAKQTRIEGVTLW